MTVRRMKTYTGETGYVYQYYFVGEREALPDAPEAPATEYIFDVTPDRKTMFAVSVFVREEARRTGLGRALVDAAVERARTRGCKRIELDVNEEDPRALGFYQALGFTLEPKPPGRNLFIGRAL